MTNEVMRELAETLDSIIAGLADGTLGLAGQAHLDFLRASRDRGDVVMALLVHKVITMALEYGATLMLPMLISMEPYAQSLSKAAEVDPQRN